MKNLDVITFQLALHLPLLYFFVNQSCFKFALQTMKKKSFSKKTISWASSSWTNSPFAITTASIRIYSSRSSLYSSFPCQHLQPEPSLSDRALQTMSQTTPY